uniref:Uncharacterized protein n=1 Tax=Rhodosorus marinus TaxID=101924 RepID=A0A7S0G0Y3_9RHOD|mmetsp:Transcript_14672/g.21507  ORF Transcript_14672/g.21507 Transcript_14672/m.21507 type:complete len:263 (+) Transcript_14672:85-873(+)
MTVNMGVGKTTKRAKVVKDPWTAEEDQQLTLLVSTSGLRSWTKIARCLERRTGKQCRERWLNYLDPSIKHDAWTHEEDMLLVQLQKKYKNKWAAISKFMDGRTDNAIKNRWNSALKRIVEAVDEQNATSPMTSIGSNALSELGEEIMNSSDESSLISSPAKPVPYARTSRKMSEIDTVLADTFNFGRFNLPDKVEESTAIATTEEKPFWGVVPEHAYSSRFLDDVLEQCVDSSVCSELESPSTWTDSFSTPAQDQLTWTKLF